MRVVIFSESEMWGGLEAHAAAFAEFLVTIGHQVVIVCLGARAYDLYRQAAPDGVTLVKLIPPVNRTVWNWWRSLRHLKADAAVLEKGTLRSGGLALDCVLKLKYRRYIAIQQLEPPDLPPRTSRRHLAGLVPGIGLWWYRWKWSGYARSIAPDVTVCVSHSVRRQLASDYAFAARKLVTIHNGVNIERFRPDARKRADARRAWGVSDDAFVFGSVRRFVHEKGLDLAIEAFARIVAERPSVNARLVLIGEGPEHARLVSLSEHLGVADRVIFPGFLATPWNAYPGFDAFLIPSRVEALGIVVLEAMASGCFVIGSRVGGIPEMISNPALGTLVLPDDSFALADAMQSVLAISTAERELTVCRAREHVTEHFEERARCMEIASLLQRPGTSRVFLPGRPVDSKTGIHP